MITIDISDHRNEILELLSELHERYGTVEHKEFLSRAALYAHDLPFPLKEALLDFRLTEKHAACRVAGFTIDDGTLGETPTHWRNREELERSRLYDFYLVLTSQLLGDTVSWATEQAGHLVHEVFPIKGNDGGQLGTSTDQLAWHTEDAFHPERMDYVALMAVRNHDKVPTTYASVSELGLDPETRKELFREAYPFLPDEGNRADRDIPPDESGMVADKIRKSHARVLDMYDNPQKVSALFGDEHDPYIRVHPYYIGEFSDDQKAYEAFEKLKDAINTKLSDVVLEPGDLFFLDNFKAVHGRKEIPGRYNGTDRWLKRAFIVRDLRKTRELRVAADDRCVY